ncbi:WD40-repeat-containing domain protein [Aspergillus novoparasiticus]|uniref:WD40-repeat-containing domain protein n=1 Tax=Aspergillus novoparasiticus TaxID=986946 RepID=A0A5N6E5V3_9EURO|nr:WD40-repeat-containing domain protein [Aspergillus novoparasiticus]
MVSILRRDEVYGIAFSPDGKQLASASHDRTTRLWDSVTGGLLRLLQSHTGDIYEVAFSPDGIQLASSSEDKTLRLWART